MHKLILTAVIFFILGGFVVSSFNTIKSQKIPNSEQPNQQVKTTPSPVPCATDDRYIETRSQPDSEIARVVFNNQAALQLIKDKCMWVFGAVKGDLLGSGEENIVFWGSGVGCGSCHLQTVYVLSGNKVILEKWMGDPKVEITKDNNGKDVLSIVEPLRKEDEGWCCPSWGVKTLYRWSKDPLGFYAFDSSPYRYESNDF